MDRAGVQYCLHCTLKRCYTALHCILLHCKALYCTVLHFSSLHHAALYSSPLPDKVLLYYCITVLLYYCTVLHCLTRYCLSCKSVGWLTDCLM